MRRALIGILFLAGLAYAIGQGFTLKNPNFVASLLKPAAGGGGCTVNSGNVLNECFEGTGYELTWTEPSGTPNEDAALDIAFSRLGTQCAEYTSAAGEYSLHDTGSGTASDRYFRLYINLDSGIDTDTEYVDFLIGAPDSTLVDKCFTVRIQNVEGGIRIKLPGGNNLVVSRDAWFRVEVKWVKNGASELKVYDSADVQVGTTQSFTGGNFNFRYLAIGNVSDVTAAVNMQLDGVGVSSSGYLGQ